MNALIDRTPMKCSVCGAPAMGGRPSCECWARCDCGWFYRTGESCRNSIHAAAEQEGNPQ